jgi:NAD(P)H-dependent FMN reductase
MSNLASLAFPRATVHAAEAGPADVLAADGLIFATPENLAAMSGPMKDFFDRNHGAAFERVNGRPYACLVRAGSDGSNAVGQIARIATGWRLRQFADALIVCTHAQAPEEILLPKRIERADLARCEHMGAAIATATGLVLGTY